MKIQLTTNGSIAVLSNYHRGDEGGVVGWVMLEGGGGDTVDSVGDSFIINFFVINHRCNASDLFFVIAAPFNFCCYLIKSTIN